MFPEKLRHIHDLVKFMLFFSEPGKKTLYEYEFGGIVINLSEGLRNRNMDGTFYCLNFIFRLPLDDIIPCPSIKFQEKSNSIHQNVKKSRLF